MRRTLHLHVGLPKAASSTIQSILLNNRDFLKVLGFSYPVPIRGGKFGNGMPLVQFFSKGTLAAERFEFHNPGALDFNNLEEYFKKTYLNHDVNNIIISSESLFHSVQKFDFNFMFHHFDSIKVHMVIRPKVFWAESSFFQNVKIGTVRDEFGNLLRNGWYEPKFRKLCYPKIYSFWREKVGAENIHLHFLSEKFGTIEKQFLTALLGFMPDNFDIPERKNVALGIVPLTAITSIDISKVGVSGHWDILRKIIRTANRLGVNNKKSVLNDENVRYIYDRFLQEDKEFVAMQGKVTLADLRPNLDARSKQATTFSETRDSEEYAKLRRALKRRHDISV